MKFRNVFIFLLLVAIGSLAWIKYKGVDPDEIIEEETVVEEIQKDPRYNREISIGEAKLLVQIVRTPAELNKGLSGREKLAEENGMLFVYDGPQKVNFWMPDMNFPLDIIFLSSNEVVYIEPNVPNPAKDTPKEELEIYSPNMPVDMALETVAGWTEKNGVEVGSVLEMGKE
jgi:uncharacterized membrane protein (UPF0127 family)